MQSFSRRGDTPSWHVAQRFHTVFVSSKHLHKLGSNVGIPRACGQTVTRAVQVQCSGYTSQVFKLCSRRALSRYQNKRLLLSVPQVPAPAAAMALGCYHHSFPIGHIKGSAVGENVKLLFAPTREQPEHPVCRSAHGLSFLGS